MEQQSTKKKKALAAYLFSWFMQLPTSERWLVIYRALQSLSRLCSGGLPYIKRIVLRPLVHSHYTLPASEWISIIYGRKHPSHNLSVMQFGQLSPMLEPRLDMLHLTECVTLLILPLVCLCIVRLRVVFSNSLVWAYCVLWVHQCYCCFNLLLLHCTDLAPWPRVEWFWRHQHHLNRLPTNWSSVSTRSGSRPRENLALSCQLIPFQLAVPIIARDWGMLFRGRCLDCCSCVVFRWVWSIYIMLWISRLLTSSPSLSLSCRGKSRSSLMLTYVS